MSVLDRLLRRLGYTKRRGTRAYTGAILNRLTTDWPFSYQSPDQIVRATIRELRDRARELARNNAVARRYVELAVHNTIGPRGIRLAARMRDADGTLLDEENAELEAAWNDWAQWHASADGRASFAQLQQHVVRARQIDGEAFALRIMGYDNPYGFAVQLVPADLVDDQFSEPRAGGREIRLGVEVDAWGRPLAYHVWSQFEDHYTAPTARQRRRLDANIVCHLANLERVGQTRGVSRLAPVMVDLHFIGKYQEAELVAARMAAAKGGFFVRKGEDAAASFDGEAEKIEMEIEPGTYEELPIGVEFQPHDPQHPSAQYGEFIKTSLQTVAAGLDVAYASLAADLSEVNFSSMRGGMLQERDGWRCLQAEVIERFCWPVYRDWVKMARLAGVLSDRVAPEQYLEVEWQPRGWAWVDPDAEVKAAKQAILLGLSSRRRELGAQGLDFGDLLRDLAQEEAMAEAAGVTINGGDDDDEAKDDDKRPARNDAAGRAHTASRSHVPAGNGRRTDPAHRDLVGVRRF